jgi:endonuclease-3 related protein
MARWRWCGTAVARPQITQVLDTLEALYGTQHPTAPTDPYEFLIWWHCGYPPSEERCAKGWQALIDRIGIAPRRLISSTPVKLGAALKAGGMVPALRAARLKEIATRVVEEHAGDLRSSLARLPATQARKLLKTFPGISNPGADRILLFARIEPLAAVPSASPYVLVRVAQGPEGEKYAATYTAAQQMQNTLSAEFDARIRGYLLLSRHGREICKRTNPACQRCPLKPACAFAKGAKKQQ